MSLRATNRIKALSTLFTICFHSENNKLKSKSESIVTRLQIYSKVDLSKLKHKNTQSKTN